MYISHWPLRLFHVLITCLICADTLFWVTGFVCHARCVRCDGGWLVCSVTSKTTLGADCQRERLSFFLSLKQPANYTQGLSRTVNFISNRRFFHRGSHLGLCKAIDSPGHHRWAGSTGMASSAPVSCELPSKHRGWKLVSQHWHNKLPFPGTNTLRRALSTASYTGSMRAPLLSAACWMLCSHLLLAKLCKHSMWLRSTLVVKNSTMLSITSSSSPVSSEATNSRKAWNAFGDSFPTLPSWG